MRAELVLIPMLLLAACASEPRPVDPPLLKAAYETEGDGAKRYQRGELALAERRFTEAMRRFVAIDDAAGRERNRLHIARTRLALGRSAAALELLDAAPTASESVAADLLRAQAQLALRQTDAAQVALDRAARLCTEPCREAAGVQLLRGRIALARGQSMDAVTAAEASRKLLHEETEPVELANAWRLLAAAHLAAGATEAALAAAGSALALDRKLALPEKIARDWLLFGDIHRAQARAAIGGAAALAVAAFREAADVAEAAGLTDICALAIKAIEDIAAKKI